MEGKTDAITGTTSGTGFVAAQACGKLGARVLLLNRPSTRADAALNDLQSHNSNADFTQIDCDLQSFSSVREAAKNLRALCPEGLDVLCNNAGVMALEDIATADGFDVQMQTNHLSHFLLTSLLLSSISKEGRIVNVGSAAYILAANDFIDHDFQSSKRYIPFIAYGNTKACNLYFTYELNRRLNITGSKVKAIVTHPGYTATNLQVNRYPFWSIANALFAMKVEDGALSQIIAAVDPDINSSMYNFLGPKYLTFGFPVVEYVGKVKDATLQKLWSESIRLTGAKYSSLKDK